jgi:polygalacturonase
MPTWPMVKPIPNVARDVFPLETDIVDQLIDKTAPWVDIKADFGAVGDDTTDNTTAIQNAITAMAAEGGGVVFVPSDIFRTGKLTLPNTVILRGSGYGSCLKAKNGLNDDLIVWANGSQFIGIENLRLSGNSANNASGAAINGPSLFVGSWLDKLIIEDFIGKGIVGVGWDRVFVNAYIDNCGDEGIRLQQCTRMVLVNAASERSGQSCMYFDRCDQTVAILPSVEQTVGTGKDGMTFDSCRGTTLVSPFGYGGSGAPQRDMIRFTDDAVGGRTDFITVIGASSINWTNNLDNIPFGKVYTEAAHPFLNYTTQAWLT